MFEVVLDESYVYLSPEFESDNSRAEFCCHPESWKRYTG
jgi:hypothetical protein